MPGTIIGIGMIFYGESRHRPDGSYLTTKWFSIFYVPIFQLKSYRVMRNPEEDVNLLFYMQEGLIGYEQTGICWKQVLETYGFFLLCVLWWGIHGIAASISCLTTFSPCPWPRSTTRGAQCGMESSSSFCAQEASPSAPRWPRPQMECMDDLYRVDE